MDNVRLSAEVFDNYDRRLGSTGKTRALYLHFAGDFLEYAQSNLERETILKYLEHLRSEHKYSGGSLNLVFRIIRTMFSRSEELLRKNGIEWSFTRGEAPQIREDEIEAPALDPGVVIEMIQAIKEVGEPDEKAFLALSSIYGLRKIELRNLSQADVNLKDKVLHVTTAKHGRERSHSIPEEIIPYVGGYDFETVISDTGLLVLWYRIEHKIGLEHIDQVGFHSLRRTVNTELLDHLPENIVMSFLRWKQRTSSHMPYRYSAQRYVGREGMITKVVGQAKDVDSKVFEVHPFLKYWGV